MGPVRHAKKLVRSGSLPPEEAFLANATYFDGGEKTQLYAPQVSALLDDVNP